jgi:hypothetical protein
MATLHANMALGSSGGSPAGFGVLPTRSVQGSCRLARLKHFALKRLGFCRGALRARNEDDLVAKILNKRISLHGRHS